MLFCHHYLAHWPCRLALWAPGCLHKAKGRPPGRGRGERWRRDPWTSPSVSRHLNLYLHLSFSLLDRFDWLDVLTFFFSCVLDSFEFNFLYLMCLIVLNLTFYSWIVFILELFDCFYSWIVWLFEFKFFILDFFLCLNCLIVLILAWHSSLSLNATSLIHSHCCGHNLRWWQR